MAELMQTMDVPELVTPRAPRGEQKAPGCTTGKLLVVVVLGGTGFVVVLVGAVLGTGVGDGTGVCTTAGMR